jgi:cytochrome P450
MAVFQICLSLIVLYCLYTIFRLVQNYLKVRKSGFPIILSPVDQANPVWVIASALVMPTLRRILPYSILRSLDLSTYGFEWRDYVAGRTRPSSWILLGPGKIDVFTQDSTLMNAVLGKRRQFPMDPSAMIFLGAAGPNLIASEGEDWQRQRRLIAPMLNEKIMDTVWQESRAQAGDMLSSFLKEGGTTRGTVEGLRRIAFNVLQCIGYGMPHGWGEDDREVPAGHKMAYMEALHELIEGFILIAVVRSVRVLTLPIWPSVIKRKGYALREFLIYTQDLLEKEREAGLESDRPRNSMLSLLAAISESSAKEKVTGVPSAEKQILSDDEVRGNLYQFTLAGFDTTANTLAYAVTTLAVEPKWQDWIIEEIDQVQKSLAGTEAGYPDIVPRLERCLALMVSHSIPYQGMFRKSFPDKIQYETLRLFTPVAHVVRESNGEQIVKSGDKTYIIPDGARVTTVFHGVHGREEIWGPDHADFRPTRWTESTTSEDRTPASTSVPQPPNLQPPVKGAFLPWSTGPRICPGMKMAQVEFLSVIWTIFKDYRVSAAMLGGESLAAAQKRLRGVMMNSEPRITLQMMKPRDAIMRWEKRR